PVLPAAVARGSLRARLRQGRRVLRALPRPSRAGAHAAGLLPVGLHLLRDRRPAGLPRLRHGARLRLQGARAAAEAGAADHPHLRVGGDQDPPRAAGSARQPRAAARPAVRVTPRRALRAAIAVAVVAFLWFALRDQWAQVGDRLSDLSALSLLAGGVALLGA